MAGFGSPREEVFAAVDFRSFGENRCSSVSNEHIPGDAGCRIGGDAAVAVAAAAIEPQDDLRDGDRDARLVDLGKHP